MLRFANDIAMLANTKREVDLALNSTETVFIKYNVKMNITKTKVFVSRIKPGKKCIYIKIGNEKIGKIKEFCYSE